MYPILFSSIFIFWIMAFNVYAGDVASRSIVGVSENGQYLAYEEEWQWDDTSVKVCRIFFLNVPNNQWAAKPIEVTIDQGKNKNPCRQVMTTASSIMNNLGIIPGVGLWSRMMNREISEVIPSTAGEVFPPPAFDHVKFHILNSPPFSSHKRKYVALSLKERSTTDPTCGKDAKIVSLSLSVEGRDHPLQQDSNLSSFRRGACPLGYRIGEAWIRQEPSDKKSFKILVFLDMFVFGGEGNSRRTLPITGSFRLTTLD